MHLVANRAHHQFVRTASSVGAWRYAPRRAADKSAAVAKRRELAALQNARRQTMTPI
jgi:hypothetical protein